MVKAVAVAALASSTCAQSAACARSRERVAGAVVEAGLGGIGLDRSVMARSRSVAARLRRHFCEVIRTLTEWGSIATLDDNSERGPGP